MGFRVACHGDAEIGEFAFDQADQFIGILKSAVNGLEARLTLWRIASQRNDAVDAALAAVVK